jgi:hypothetical protein
VVHAQSSPPVTGRQLREPRLRAEAAERYPGIPAAEWLPASRVATDCLRVQRREPGFHHVAGRLPQEDFEFRGGPTEAVVRD